MKQTTEQYLYCAKAGEVVTLTVEHELKQLVGGNKGYACYSITCSVCNECGCSANGNSSECNALFSQAKHLAKKELLNE